MKSEIREGRDPRNSEEYLQGGGAREGSPGGRERKRGGEEQVSVNENPQPECAVPQQEEMKHGKEGGDSG